jgi:predicted Zn-dependent protease with MMP-like domain
MTPEEFTAVARRAIENLPEEFRPHVAEIDIVVEPHASDELLDELGVPEDEDIYGLFEGTYLTERSIHDAPEMPPRITLFYEPLLEDCETEEELVHEIQVTVLHEIGHFFGLEEEDLERLGFG